MATQHNIIDYVHTEEIYINSSQPLGAHGSLKEKVGITVDHMQPPLPAHTKIQFVIISTYLLAFFDL